jgi:hypothetical protein
VPVSYHRRHHHRLRCQQHRAHQLPLHYQYHRCTASAAVCGSIRSHCAIGSAGSHVIGATIRGAIASAACTSQCASGYTVHHGTGSACRSDFDTYISCYTISTTVVFDASGAGCATFHCTQGGHECGAIRRSECCTFGSAACRDFHPIVSRAVCTPAPASPASWLTAVVL